MRTLDRSLGALLLTAGLTGPALAAENSEVLSVERSADAADCPSASELEARLAGVRGSAKTPSNVAYRIAFARTGGTLSATIRAADGSTRLIESHDESCASLAQATAITLALLLDSEPQTEANSPAVAPASSARPETTRTASVASPGHRAEARVRLALGAGALFGVVSPAAPVLGVEGGLELGRFRAGLGGLWAFPRTLSLGPGNVRERLFAGTARACFALALAQPTDSSWGRRLDACSGLYAGAQRAEASGYTTNERLTRNWLAAPAELAFSQDFGALGLELAATALFPLVRNEFVVDGQGIVYSAAKVSALVAIRAVGVLPW
ncbi:MAG TPA: hypothetical protein VG937_13095 [Polyangiaceae bacterium]|jgi:hypothetical protein|nr:hypothetical protein [Polyangiaceae bacterium]